MKKLLSILLSVSMIFSAMVSFANAEEETAQIGADYFPLWKLTENATVTIERVFDEITGSYAAKVSTDGTGTSAYNALYYTVPKSKLVANRSYTLKFYLRTAGLSNPVTENAETWMQIDSGGYDNTPWVHTGSFKGQGTVMSYTCNNLYDYNHIAFGLTKGAKETFWVDNIQIIDDTTGEALDLENLDFESVAADYASNTELPGWKVATDVAGATVERVFHETYGSWMLKITNDGTGKDIDKVRYTVPKTRLTEGHTYKVTMYGDIDSDATTGYVYFAGGGKTYSNTYIPNNKNGATITLTGANLYSSNSIVFGFDTNLVGEWYLDNLVVTDETTGEVVALENSDFEKVNADYIQPATAVNMSGWTVGTSDSYKVERAYHFVMDSWTAKITTTGVGTSAWNAITYWIPKEKLVEGRTYTVKGYLWSDGLTNATNGEQWAALDFGGNTDNLPWVHNMKSGMTVTKTGIGLYGNNKAAFGLTNAKVEVLYVDNLEIIDETTGEALDLPNLDFETVLDSSVEFTFDGMMCNADIISTKEEYPIYMVCAVYKADGTLFETTLYPYDVVKSDEVQTFGMFPAVYGEGYTTKAMLWNADTLEPLAPAIDIE